jgi:hypothetical protein
MSDGFVWVSYIVTYGLIIGYVVIMLGRLGRSRRGS